MRWAPLTVVQPTALSHASRGDDDDERLPGGGAVPVRRADRCLPAAAGVVQAGVVQAGQPSGTPDAHAQYTIDRI
jgi:hypothetical protein